MSRRVVIVGAGVSGLAAAHRVLERDGGDSVLDTTDRDTPSRPLEVLVLEAASRAGGMLQTECVDGYVIERGPDSILTSKPAALDLAMALGLEDRIVRTRSEARGAYILTRGRLERVPTGFQVLAPSALLSLWRSPILSVGWESACEPLRSHCRRVLQNRMKAWAASYAGDSGRSCSTGWHNPWPRESTVRRRTIEPDGDDAPFFSSWSAPRECHSWIDAASAAGGAGGKRCALWLVL